VRQDLHRHRPGKNAARPELDKALAYLREGDVLVITRLSRAM
jgi:DNA invertase Pin-like site-specific DNA recombinase